MKFNFARSVSRITFVTSLAAGVIGCCTFSSAARASAALATGLGKDSDSNLNQAPPPLANPVIASAPEVFETSRYDRSHVDLFGGFGYQNFMLQAGSGSEINLSNADFPSWGARVKYQNRTRNWGAMGSFESSSASFNVPGNTSAVVSRTSMIKGVLTTKPFLETTLWFESVELGLGYFYSNRKANRGSLTDIVSDAVKSGPLVTMSYIAPLNETLCYRIAPEIGFINSFRESSTTTGSYASGFFLNSKFLFLYALSKRLSLAAGLDLQLERVEFSGTGGRALTDATETTISYGIPVELQYQF